MTDLPAIWIPGQVPSLKNAKKIIPIGGKNVKRRYIIAPSDAHAAYHKANKQLWLAAAGDFKDATFAHTPPLIVGFYFVRKTANRFDYGNAIQTCEDLMTECGWIADDNAAELKSIPLDYHVDKHRPGVWIVPATNLAYLHGWQPESAHLGQQEFFK